MGSIGLVLRILVVFTYVATCCATFGFFGSKTPPTTVAPIRRALPPQPPAIPTGPARADNEPHYTFRYVVQDARTGDFKSQEERRDGGKVRGTYSVAEPNGDLRVVSYSSDSEGGFRAEVRVEPNGAVLTPDDNGRTFSSFFPDPIKLVRSPLIFSGQPPELNSMMPFFSPHQYPPPTAQPQYAPSPAFFRQGWQPSQFNIDRTKPTVPTTPAATPTPTAFRPEFYPRRPETPAIPITPAPQAPVYEHQGDIITAYSVKPQPPQKQQQPFQQQPQPFQQQQQQPQLFQQQQQQQPQPFQQQQQQKSQSSQQQQPLQQQPQPFQQQPQPFQQQPQPFQQQQQPQPTQPQQQPFSQQLFPTNIQMMRRPSTPAQPPRPSPTFATQTKMTSPPPTTPLMITPSAVIANMANNPFLFARQPQNPFMRYTPAPSVAYPPLPQQQQQQTFWNPYDAAAMGGTPFMLVRTYLVPIPGHMQPTPVEPSTPFVPIAPPKVVQKQPVRQEPTVPVKTTTTAEEVVTVTEEEKEVSPTVITKE